MHPRASQRGAELELGVEAGGARPPGPLAPVPPFTARHEQLRGEVRSFFERELYPRADE